MFLHLVIKVAGERERECYLKDGMKKYMHKKKR